MNEPSRIASPCLRVCMVEAHTNICAGCGRTLKEIAGWLRFSDSERAAIMAGLPARMKAAGLQPQAGA